MKICGIELKSNNAIVSIIQSDTIDYIDLKIKKISLDDDEKKESMISFKDNINEFLAQNNIDKVAIKKRAKKGNFAGGAITFKMEAIIQLNAVCDVTLVTSQAIAKYTKNNDVEFPNMLNKYQEQSYLSALLLV